MNLFLINVWLLRQIYRIGEESDGNIVVRRDWSFLRRKRKFSLPHSLHCQGLNTDFGNARQMLYHLDTPAPEGFDTLPSTYSFRRPSAETVHPNERANKQRNKRE